MAMKAATTHPPHYVRTNGRLHFKSRATETLDRMARVPSPVKKVGLWTPQKLVVVEAHKRSSYGMPKALRLVRLLTRLKEGS